MGRGPGARWGVVDDNKKSRPWKNLVAQVAGDAMAGRDVMQGPIRLTLRFFRTRPKSHHRTNGDVSASAPSYPTTKPDVLKLARAVEDALSGVVYVDDAQIVDELLTKEFGPERVEIKVETMEADDVEA